SIVSEPFGSIDGATTLVVPNGYSAVIICSGSAFFTNKVLARLQQKADSYEVGSFIDGLTLYNNVANPNTHIDFAAGSARSGSRFASSASTMTKRLN
ncbi:hypothetical protein AB9F41_33885, partial [Rhizobium leguminosarum]